MKAYEELANEGLITPVQGKGYYVNAQDSDMLREQHMRQVENSLNEAIHAARIAHITDDELKETLNALLEITRE